MTPDKYYTLDLQLFDELSGIPEVPDGEHLSPDQIEAYLAGLLVAADERQADIHFASCSECLSLAERVLKSPAADIARPILVEERPASVVELLGSSGAIQTGFEYVMPSRINVDTHISLAKVCWSDIAVDQLVEAIDWRLAQRSFRVILCHGWPMAHIARRLIWRYRPKVHTIIEAEGHEPLIFNRVIPRNASVLILTDVTLSGELVARLEERVKNAGARVAARMAIVDARNDQGSADDVLSLCSMSIGRSPSAIKRTSGTLERRHFNPCSYNPTVKKENSRSPLHLFDRDAGFADLWSRVFVSGAYEHHHVDGAAHHTGFIDTERLLEHPLTGEAVVDDLAGLVLADDIPPSVVLVPRRHRGRLVGMRLAESIYRRTGVLPTLINVGIRRGRALISEASKRRMRGQAVVVCDSAAGHGATLDMLCEVSRTAGAARIGAAIVVSRLKESCEDALRARLGGRFWRLYYFPTPSFMVSQSDSSACPYCAIKSEIIKVAERFDLPALQALADSFAAIAGDRSHDRVVPPRERPSSGGDFLRRCERRMAGGLTLHALCTAMNDGMAPLELPEVLDASIPPTKRAAMLESLPTGALEWSGPWLERSVYQCLAPESPRQVWLAAANLLGREGRCDWVDHLAGQLARRQTHMPPKYFWGWLVFNTLKYVTAKPTEVTRVREKIRNAVATSDPTARAGMREVLEAIRRVELLQTTH